MLCFRFMVNVYYVVICAWAIFYLCAGFQKNLPWASCLETGVEPSMNSSMEDWHTPDCYSIELDSQCKKKYNDSLLTFYNGSCTSYNNYCIEHEYTGYAEEKESCYTSTDINGTLGNTTMALSRVITDNAVYPSEDYLNGLVLGYTIPGTGGERHSWDDYGSLSWELSLCLLLSWILIGLSMIKGLQSYGKVAYVITLSPYFVLTALIIYVAMLDGAKEGIEYFITPKWEELKVCMLCQ